MNWVVRVKWQVVMMVCGCGWLPARGQSAEQLLADGIAAEKKYKVPEALAKYEATIAANPQLAEPWWRASRMLSNIGGHIDKKQADEKRSKYEQAKKYALKSIELNPRNPEARLAHIISMGLLAEMAGNPREKIRDAKIIREEAEATLALDSAFAPIYFVLGKWHYELAKLNWLEQMAVKLFFGGMPENVSMTRAIEYLRKASRLEPNTILYMYGEASVLDYEGKKAEAIALLDRAIKLPPKEPDDILRKDKCRELLKALR
jgi:tetratricopeptide (TPR) repeat protein